MTTSAPGTAVRAISLVRSRLRLSLWVLHLALPLLALWLLVANPGVDVRWEHHAAHFGLIALVGAVSLVIGLQIERDARRNDDGRMRLVALAFQSSAGFFLLHALATPGVLLPAPNIGFALAAPVGLLLAGVFALASAVERAGAARTVRVLRGALFAALIGWAAASLLGLPPLQVPLDAEEVQGLTAGLALVGVTLYAAAAWRYYALYRRRPSVVLLSIITAFALLAAAILNMVFARNWQASWWEWHLLLLLAYGFVAYSARIQYQRAGSGIGLFNSIALEETIRRIRQEYGSALEALVEAYQEGAEHGDDERARRAIVGVTQRLDLTPGQASVLERAAIALASERQLFEHYMPPRVARSLRSDPGLRELGGDVAELTVLYADLRGFTSFSEHHDPALVVALLNRYFDVVVDRLFEAQGTITGFVGDAVMAVFNAPSPQPDHARRAADAALAIQRSVESVAAGNPEWPRFGIGINTGPALYGNIGGRRLRSLTAIGDAVNVAARLQALAEAGQVVLGPATAGALGAAASTRAMGRVNVKGRAAPVQACLLTELSAASSRV